MSESKSGNIVNSADLVGVDISIQNAYGSPNQSTHPEENHLRRLCTEIRRHLHFFIVVALLTTVMTFPTIVHVFKTDVFWLPTGDSSDISIHIWDIWYWKEILSGQAD